MTTIWIDPAELFGAAAVLGQQGVRARDAAMDAYRACAEVPAAVAGLVHAEMEAITADALSGVIAHVEQALDAKRRADQVQAEQSATSAAFSRPGWSMIGGPNSFDAYSHGVGVTGLVGGPNAFDPYDNEGGVSFQPRSREESLAATPLLGAAQNMQNRNPAGAAQLFGLQSTLDRSNQNRGGLWALSFGGVTSIGDGLYSGPNGRIGTISDVYPLGGGRYEVV